MPIELLLLVIAKALVELAGLFLLGRALCYLLTGRRRDQNIFYQVFCIITNPVLRAARFVTPRVVLDRHIPTVAVVLLFWIWLALAFWALPQMCNSGRYDCSTLMERKRAD